MDPTDIRYILDDLACNASQEALQELYMLYYKRIARYIGLYVRYDGAVMELTSSRSGRTVLNFPKSGISMLKSTGSPNSRH